jgi:hypothetical protein
MSSFYDDFNRPDAATLGSSWINQVAGMQVVGNTAKSVSQPSPLSLVDVATNQDVTVTAQFSAILKTANNQSERLFLRYVDANNCVILMHQANGSNSAANLYFLVFNNGSAVYLPVTATSAKADSDKLSVVIETGNVFKIYKNDVFVRQDTINYASINSGTKFGINVNNDGTTRFDWFSVIDANSPLPPPYPVAISANRNKRRK